MVKDISFFTLFLVIGNLIFFHVPILIMRLRSFMMLLAFSFHFLPYRSIQKYNLFLSNNYVPFIFKGLFFLFTLENMYIDFERGEGRERGREREKH